MRKLYALLAGLFLSLASSATPSPDIAGFTYVTDHAAKNVVFTNTSVIGSEPGTRKAFWTFGDGSGAITAPLAGTQHHYALPGTYEVCLRIYRYRPTVNDSVLSAQVCHIIIVNTVCGADFVKLPVTANDNPLRAFFKAQPEHNGEKRPARICWEFGDGHDTCIQYSNTVPGPYTVSHTYAHEGMYEVCVKILYQGGCEARRCRDIRIQDPESCRADFEKIPTPDADPLNTYFKALPQHNNNRKPARVCWEFGDNHDTCINYPENYTGQYAVGHRYTQPGNYEVCVKIFYYGGCEARKCRMINIPPVTSCSVRLFEITPSITSLVRGFLAIPHSAPVRRPVRVCWIFGDGEDTCIMPDPGQPVPYLFIQHTYPAPGVYRACIRVLFDGGCLAEDCREVVIRPLSDICGGYMSDSLAGPKTFIFKGFSIHAPNDEATSFHWTFGDGSSASGREVTHTYDHGGDYHVCLLIRTRLGCETNICRTVRVPGNNQPALTLSPNPVENNLHAEFISTHTEQVVIRILNSSGTVLRIYQRNVTVGLNTWNFDVSNLLPGIYSFVLQSPNQLASAIFIKQ